MTRKDFYTYAKKYGIAIIVALPVLILINVLMSGTNRIYLILIDCVVLLAIFFIVLYLAQKIRDRTTQKRAEFVAKKESEAQAQQAQEFAQRQEDKKQEKETKKTIQKQIRNYPKHKSK